MSKVLVVAINLKEACEIARDRPDVVHRDRLSAIKHLKQVQAPPTDPDYAAQYRVYEVEDPATAGEQETGKV